NGASTTYYFEYGTTYGSTTTETDAGSGTEEVSVSADLTGLSEGTTYHFRLVATNSAGTDYGDDATFTTTTTAPTVSSTNPANNATDVDVNTTITATFSEAMDASTITTDSFLVNDGTINIAGTVTTVTQSGTVATFSPTTALDYSTTYTATITTGAKDLAGNALEADYTWSFTTASTPTTTTTTTTSTTTTSTTSSTTTTLPSNNPPTADAGPDQTVDEGVTVTLDGSNSSDPDNGIASYLWSQIVGSPVTLSDLTATRPTFITPPVDLNGTT
ncbi:unnamed protein product, partial [marine sediment metagenome]